MVSGTSSISISLILILSFCFSSEKKTVISPNEESIDSNISSALKVFTQNKECKNKKTIMLSNALVL